MKLSDAQVVTGVVDGRRPPRPPQRATTENGVEIRIDDELWNVIESCWDHEPTERPTSRELVAMVCSSRPACEIERLIRTSCSFRDKRMLETPPKGIYRCFVSMLPLRTMYQARKPKPNSNSKHHQSIPSESTRSSPLIKTLQMKTLSRRRLSIHILLPLQPPFPRGLDF
jgi:hypothetical protein